MEVVADDRWRNLVNRHLVTAQVVRNRLTTARLGAPLTAQEVIDGVKLTHEEYINLVELAAIGFANKTLK